VIQQLFGLPGSKILEYGPIKVRSCEDGREIVITIIAYAIKSVPAIEKFSNL